MKKIIMDERSFWPSVEYCVNTMPLVEVLKLVDREKHRQRMRAKEKIANNLYKKVSSYKEIWEIIDKKWDM